MANGQINKLLEFANMQMAAEAFLSRSTDDIPNRPPEGQIETRLELGNNHISKFMPVQAERFIAQYEVLTQYRNDSLLPGKSGFSGTLFRNRSTGELTLSFRSTEFIDDAARDNKATNQMELKELGWGFGQIAEMEAWYAQLRADPNLLAGKSFNVTGYSLGGHLATAFNILRREEYAATPEFNPIIATYTFNGAGTGSILNGRQLTDLIADFNRIRGNYIGSPEWTALSPGEQNSLTTKAQIRIDAITAERSRVAGLSGLDPSFGVSGPSGDQILPSYQIAALLIARNTIGMSGFPFPGGTNFLPTSPVYTDSVLRFSNMMEIVGMETGGLAASFTSNSGVHYGSRQEVHIEAQPLYRGNWLSSFINEFPSLLINDPGKNNFGDTHSLVLLVDSLSLMAVMERLAPTITIETAGQIFGAMSNAAAATLGSDQGKAEGDTLERMLDALRKLVMGSQDATLNDEQMRKVLEGNTWHDAAYRGPFQTNLTELRDYVDAIVSIPDVTFTIDSLVSTSAAQLAALSLSTEAIAYRYALKELNPFAIVGNNDLYFLHNVNGDLNLYSPVTGTGLTRQYLSDRAEMLGWKNVYYQKDGNVALRGDRIETLQFTDKSIKDDRTGQDLTLTVVGRNSLLINIPAKIIFGGNADEVLIGSDVAAGDHLYGGGGADTLQGNQGNDYLEGGSGNDTYVWNSGDGFDTIMDTDGIGRLLVNGKVVPGGIKVAQNDYVSADKHTLHFEGDLVTGGVLLVNGNLRIENFASGDLGIVLNDQGSFAEIQTTSRTYLAATSVRDHELYGGDGNDHFIAAEGISLFLGKAGDDLIEGHGFDHLRGGAGNDVISVAEFNEQGLNTGDLILSGGPGADIILGGVGGETIYGDMERASIGADAVSFSVDGFSYDGLAGAGQYDNPGGGFGFSSDELRFFPGGIAEALNYVLGITESTNFPSLYDDFVDGGGGADLILGGYGSDVLFGGEGDDWIGGDAFGGRISAVLNVGGYASLFGLAGDDYIDGGGGNDHLFDREGGNDVLIGGDGNDRLFSSDPLSESRSYTNYLEGGEGNDMLVSSNRSLYGFDLLIGGPGNDVYQVEFGSARIEDSSGSDTYIVRDWSPISPSLLPRSLVINDFDDTGSDADQLYLPPELALSDPASTLSLTRDESNLYFGLSADPIWITLENWFTGPEYKIEQIVFGTPGSDELPPQISASYDVATIESRFTTATAGADFLWGSSADDQLAGGLGDDTLFGGAGNDVLAGNEGNDALDGGEGADVYVFNIGDGVDHILDSGSFDSDGILFGPGITPDMLTLGLGSLLINIGGNRDAIHLDDFDPDDAYNSNNIEFLQFFDGTTLSYQQLLDRGFDLIGTDADDTLTGTSVNDRISGFGGNDILDGGAGDDVLMGGAGDDTYFFGLSGGSDRIEDSAGFDTVMLGEGILPDGVTVSRDGDTLTLNAGSDRLAIRWQPEAGYAVEKVVFADGTAWDAAAVEAKADEVRNTAPTLANPIADQDAAEDAPFAFSVPDTAFSDPGDTLAYSAASSNGAALPGWLVFDAATRAFSGTPANTDVGVLSVRVTATDVHGASAFDTFDIAIGDAPQEVVRKGSDDDDELVGTQFGDILLGGRGNDRLIGWGGDDLLDGGAGQDRLQGEAGDDLLAGGGGNDQLEGGPGDDIYVYEREDGNDVIEDTGGADTLLLGEGIAPGKVRLERRRDDLIVDLKGRDGSVTVKGWFASDAQKVETIQFADGTAWDAQYIHSHLNRVKPPKPGRDKDDHDHDHHHNRDDHHGKSDRKHEDDHDDRKSRQERDSLAELLEAYLAHEPHYDFEALARDLERGGGPREHALSSLEIANRWQRISRYVNGLSDERDDDSRYGAGEWRGLNAVDLPGGGSSGGAFGHAGSTGARYGMANLKTLQGLEEGFHRLRG